MTVTVTATLTIGTPEAWKASDRSGLVYVPPLVSAEAVDNAIRTLKRMLEAGTLG